jgi:surface antigen
MRRIRLVLAAALAVGAALPAHAPAFAVAPSPSPTPSQQVAQLNQQLSADRVQLNDLNNQVEQAQADLDALSHRLADDQQREAALGRQLAMLGRLEYEQPVFSLSRILEAASLQQLLSNIAEARLIARKQGSLLDQARRLRQQDQQARDQVSARLADVQAARDQAAQVAARTLSLRNSVQDAAVRTLATSVSSQASATQVGGWSGTGPWPNHFTFGYCTWYVANRRYVPWFGNAIDWWANARPYGYPEGQAPQVGAILVTRESGYGHVAYVESVNGSSFTVAEMNFVAWDVVDRRTIQLGGSVPIVGFIYGH